MKPLPSDPPPSLTVEAHRAHIIRSLPRVSNTALALLEPTPSESLRAPLDFCRHPDQVEKITSLLARATDGANPLYAGGAALAGALAEACSFAGVSYELVLARVLSNSKTLLSLLP